VGCSGEFSLSRKEYSVPPPYSLAESRKQQAGKTTANTSFIDKSKPFDLDTILDILQEKIAGLTSRSKDMLRQAYRLGQCRCPYIVIMIINLDSLSFQAHPVRAERDSSRLERSDQRFG